MKSLIPSLSVVLVVEDTMPDAVLFEALLTQCVRYAAQSEIVLIANGVSDALAVELKNYIAKSSDSACLFLGTRISDDLACLAGIDNAIGDWILLPSLTEAGVAAIGLLVQAATDGADMVIGEMSGPARADRSVYGWLTATFLAFFARLSSVKLRARRAPTQLLSRAAAQHLATQGLGEILLRVESIGPGFPVSIVTLGGDWPQFRPASLGTSWGKAMRVLFAATSAPLRGASFVAVGAGILSVLYSCYIVAVYFFSPAVERGWTTLSLQVSGMMFLFSLVLMLISEYLIQIAGVIGGNRRSLPIVRELRSPVTRLGAQANVVDETGAFTVGASGLRGVTHGLGQRS